MNRTVDTVIVGGGISGAAALHWLAGAGVDALLVEREQRLGGVIGSHRNALGALVESGPNSFQLNTPLLRELVADLGLEDDVLPASPAAVNRYIMRDGRLLALTNNPKVALKTPLFSASAKLRILKEMFVRPAPADVEESVAAFVERRLGRELLDYAVNPFVAGVYAGRPERLSMRWSLPKLYALEQEFGSLFRGSLARGRAARKARKQGNPEQGHNRSHAPLSSFVDGMEALPRAIAHRWSDRIVLGRAVRGVEPAGQGWRVVLDGGIVEARHVVIATDAASAAALIDPLDREGAAALRDIEYAPVGVATSLYDRSAIAHPLDGFGMLLPEVERRKILGTIFSSTLFPNRAPEGLVALTTFIGGGRQPELLDASREEIEGMVHAELRKILGIGAKPRSVDLRIWRRAIPQYTLGYGRILEALARAEEHLPRLHLLGNYRGGVSVGDCVAGASKLASGIADDVMAGRMARRSPRNGYDTGHDVGHDLGHEAGREGDADGEMERSTNV